MEFANGDASYITAAEDLSALGARSHKTRFETSVEARKEALQGNALAPNARALREEPIQHPEALPMQDLYWTPQKLALTRARSLDYPSQVTLPQQSTASSLDYQDLEKGISADLMRHQLAAIQIEQPVDPTILKRLSRAAQASKYSAWISVPPRNLQQLPSKRQPRTWRRLRHILFAVYQRLFCIAFIANIIPIIILLATRQSSQPASPSIGNLATATAANVAVAVLIRQDIVVNALYTFFCWTPRWFPLRIRRLVAKMYEFGGVHSGCAVAATIWFVLYVAFATRNFARGDFDDPAALAVAYVILGLLLGICMLAVPRFRMVAHNTFELVHRFAGWSAIALFWAELLLLLNAESRVPGSDSLGILVIKAPAFWLLLLTTFCIILPWLRLRKVDAVSEKLSSHAMRLHFKYTAVGPVQSIRITHSPLKEWHSFASIPGPDKTFSLIVSDAGDWTKKQIAEPSPKYWVRGVPVTGVLRMAVIFRKIVVVTTGSGIGPCLSMLISSSMPARILWSTPNPQQTYGDRILQAVMKEDPKATIIDTRATGRPDMVALAYHLFMESQAEAVFVLSNPSLTRKVVYGMESRGIPAYGPVFDS